MIYIQSNFDGEMEGNTGTNYVFSKGCIFTEKEFFIMLKNCGNSLRFIDYDNTIKFNYFSIIENSKFNIRYFFGLRFPLVDKYVNIISSISSHDDLRNFIKKYRKGV